jgi:hypothetical protein
VDAAQQLVRSFYKKKVALPNIALTKTSWWQKRRGGTNVFF